MNKLLFTAVSLFISGCVMTNPNHGSHDDLSLSWQNERQENKLDCRDAELLISNLERSINKRVYSLPNGDICSHENA